MNSSLKIARLALIVSVAVFAAVAGFWLAQGSRTGAPQPADQTLLQIGPLLQLPQAKPISEFVLYDHNGAEFSRDSLKGDWTLVFFGFASCPHICPNTLFTLTTVVDELKGKVPPERLPEVLFVSVDAERDTPEVLAEYRQRFGGKLEAVSGSNEQLRNLVLDLGAHYVIPDHEPGEWYNVDHSISVHLLNPEAEWAGLMSAPHDAEAMITALETFLGDS